VTQRLPPITIHPATATRRPHRCAGKRFATLAEAERHAARLARKADCPRHIYEHPAGEAPRFLASIDAGSGWKTDAGRDRARREAAA
jgi:hypothetical protein